MKFSNLSTTSQWRYSKKSCSKTFGSIHRKTLCWSVFLIKLQARIANLLKRETSAGVFCEYCEIFKSTYTKDHLFKKDAFF